MRWLCLFSPCNWIWHFTVKTEGMDRPIASVGIYQCSRCKTISIGRPR